MSSGMMFTNDVVSPVEIVVFFALPAQENEKKFFKIVIFHLGRKSIDGEGLFSFERMASPKPQSTNA